MFVPFAVPVFTFGLSDFVSVSNVILNIIAVYKTYKLYDSIL